ncbi:hypothetical protein OS493_032406 [Desmophyllum pertusum]|uniref:Uncharacterized protein n=1 Tax=Desmophyllum pertusum TaxID=174260 RepID=A0A9W9Y8J8_9CNID|nr:hypothetical protein OS493_032406 [Desmophyllum pertusum]
MAEASPKDLSWYIAEVNCQFELYKAGKYEGKIVNALFWQDDEEVEIKILQIVRPSSNVFDEVVDQLHAEDDEPVSQASKARRKRRRAGEFSGRQIALKKLEKEKKTEEAGGGDDSTWPPPFLRTVQSMRQVLLGFSEGEEEVFTEDHATAMRVYFSKKLAVSGKDGTNSLLTNYFKLALLPKKLFQKAVRVCELYEEGELLPPSATNQRKRKNVSSSSFSFLRGFNPQSPEDQQKIGQSLDEWMATKKRPTLKKQNTSEDHTIRQELTKQKQANKKMVSTHNILRKRFNGCIDTIEKLTAEKASLEKKLKLQVAVVQHLKKEIDELNLPPEDSSAKLYEANKAILNELRSQVPFKYMELHDGMKEKKNKPTASDESSSEDEESTVPSPSKEKKAADESSSQDDESTDESSSEDEESTVPSPSKKKKAAVPFPSKKKKATVPSPSKKQKAATPVSSKRNKPTAATPVSSMINKPTAAKKVIGWAYVPVEEFKHTNIFSVDELPTSRRRKK